MLTVKCIYFLKRLIITALAFLMMALIKSAPVFPLFYTAVCVVSSCVIRMLWNSILKDEAKQKKRTRVRFSNRCYREDHREKAA